MRGHGKGKGCAPILLPHLTARKWHAILTPSEHLTPHTGTHMAESVHVTVRQAAQRMKKPRASVVMMAARKEVEYIIVPRGIAIAEKSVRKFERKAANA